MPAKSIIEKRLKIMFNRSNCDRKTQLFGTVKSTLAVGLPDAKGFSNSNSNYCNPPLILVHGFHKKRILIYSVNQKTVENEDDIKAMLKYV